MLKLPGTAGSCSENSKLFILEVIWRAWAAFDWRRWVETLWKTLCKAKPIIACLTTFSDSLFQFISIYVTIAKCLQAFAQALSSGDVGWKIYASPIWLLTTAVAGRNSPLPALPWPECHAGIPMVDDPGVIACYSGMHNIAKLQMVSRWYPVWAFQNVPNLRQVDLDGEHWNFCAQTAAANRHRTYQLPFRTHDHSFDSIDYSWLFMIMFCHLLSIVDMLDRHVPQVRLALDCNTESFTIASTIQRTRHGCDVSGEGLPSSAIGCQDQFNFLAS